MRLKHYSGLRELILTRNKFGDGFAKGLTKFLIYDKYIKVIDLAANRITPVGLNILIKNAFKEHNDSIVAFDARMNPGCSERIMHRFALIMIRNIDTARTKGIVL
jgi:Ran GTPase-activating protein (RanGAP) involved in mRNA processing and transport